MKKLVSGDGGVRKGGGRGRGRRMPQVLEGGKDRMSGDLLHKILPRNVLKIDILRDFLVIKLKEQWPVPLTRRRAGIPYPILCGTTSKAKVQHELGKEVICARATATPFLHSPHPKEVRALHGTHDFVAGLF
jgi:hypothetical protein